MPHAVVACARALPQRRVFLRCRLSAHGQMPVAGPPDGQWPSCNTHRACVYLVLLIGCWVVYCVLAWAYWEGESGDGDCYVAQMSRAADGGEAAVAWLIDTDTE